MSNRAKPSRDLYLSLLAQKFQTLIDADPVEAPFAMQRSLEYAPGLWAISTESNRCDWGTAIVGADLMIQLLAKIDWAADGDLIDEPQTTLDEILEQL